MTDLERAAQLLVHDTAWRKLPLLDQLKHLAAHFDEARREEKHEAKPKKPT